MPAQVDVGTREAHAFAWPQTCFEQQREQSVVLTLENGLEKLLDFDSGYRAHLLAMLLWQIHERGRVI